jgi:hypothetical protein
VYWEEIENVDYMLPQTGIKTQIYIKDSFEEIVRVRHESKRKIYGFSIYWMTLARPLKFHLTARKYFKAFQNK